MTRPAPARLLDRDPQNLPVPLGDMTPVRVRRPRHRAALRTHLPAALLALGLCTGAMGVALLAIPPSTAAYLIGDRVHVGGMDLTVVTPAASAHRLRYEGGASYVLSELGDGTATAAAAWRSGGLTSSGLCRVHPDALRLIDECVFHGSSGSVSSIDVLDTAAADEWTRTYSDGTRVTIPVSPDGAAIPVPFPIGH